MRAESFTPAPRTRPVSRSQLISPIPSTREQRAVLTKGGQERATLIDVRRCVVFELGYPHALALFPLVLCGFFYLDGERHR